MSRRALVLAACLAAACRGGGRAARDGGAGEGPPARALTAPSPRRLPPPVVAMPTETAVRLLDAGAAPRAPLRYGFGPAARTVHVEARLRSRTLGDAGWTAYAALPPLGQAVALDAVPDADGGRLRLRALPLEVGPGELDPVAAPLVRAHRARWRAVEQRRVTARADARGRVHALAFADVPGDPGAPRTTPEPARDELWQWVLGLAVVAPEEPVGVGARWRAAVALRAGDLSLTQEIDYELVAAGDDGWTVAVVARRIGEPQATAAPDLAGARAELIGLYREVRGTFVVGPDDPLPRRGEATLELRVHARIVAPGRPPFDVATEDLGTLVVTAR